MEVTPDKQLIFSELLDYDLLESLWMSLRHSGFLLDVELIRQKLIELSGSEVYDGSISLSELQDSLAKQALEFAGEPIPSPFDRSAAEAVFARIHAEQQGINYSLPPKWLPAVIAEVIDLAESSVDRRDDLLKLMIDGQSPELATEAVERGWTDPTYAHEMETDFAQEDYDLTQHAMGLIDVISEAINLG